MKNTIKVKAIRRIVGIIALAAVIGCGVAACDASSRQDYWEIPTAADFNIGNLEQTEGSVTPVTITPKPGKSQGEISIFYNHSGTLPTAAGTYTVTFNVDVDSDNQWRYVTGLSAGTLTIDDIAIAAFKAWLDGQPDNTAATAYTYVLNVGTPSSGTYNPAGKVGAVLKDNENKYVSLDLSGSTTDSIGQYAFYQCYNLTGVTIPNSVTSIGYNAFWGCASLAGVTIGSGVTTIGDYAFYNCASLASVTIGSGVTSIGYNAFWGCTSLASVIIPNSVTSIGWDTFYGCTSLASVTIGSGVTSIKSDAFNGCTSLASVIIPNSVTSIGNNAFQNCTGLTSVTFERVGTTLNTNAFINADNTSSLRTAYTAGGIGTYTRQTTSSTTWTKQ